jgi:beta-xylosidase
VIRALVAVLVAASLVGGCGQAPSRRRGGDGASPVNPADSFTNPVYDDDAPDPQAFRAGDTWYLVHTNAGGRNVPVLTSPDLITWTPAGDALPRLPDWATPGKTWAPEVIQLVADRYVMYPTVADRASGRQCVAAAVASQPAGPYVAPGTGPLICQADLGGSIDASPFRDTDGSLYLLWKNDGNAIGADTWLWVQRLAADGVSLVGAPTQLLRQTEPWEGRVVEGPFLWRQDGRLYLFYAANAYDTADYAEGYAVCDSPLGPCRKATENPILASKGAASGPGHASMIVHNGRTWLLYHAWPKGTEGAISPGRQLWLDEVTWADGRPVVRGPTITAQRRP